MTKDVYFIRETKRGKQEVIECITGRVIERNPDVIEKEIEFLKRSYPNDIIMTLELTGSYHK